MYDRFLYLLNENGTTPYRVAKDTGVSQSVLSSWKNGRTPRPLTMRAVADYFGVNVEWLKGETDVLIQKNPPVMEDEGIWGVLQSDPMKLKLAAWIANLDQDTLNRVDQILTAAFEK